MESTAQTVVVLEDDPVQAQIMALQVEAAGCVPVSCSSAVDALARARSAGGAVTVLMDLHVPQMDAPDFCRRARAQKPGVRIIGCSASPPDAQTRALLDDFLPKPLNSAALARTLKGASPPKKPSGSADGETFAGAIDSKTFASLAQSMTPGMLRSLYAAYAKDAEQRLGLMRQAHVAADLDTLRRAAHTLKGASGMLGAQRVAQTAFALESVGPQGLREAEELLQQLEACVHQANNSAREKLDSIGLDAGRFSEITEGKKTNEQRN